MREETRRRLERTLFLRRLKWIGAGLAATAAMGATFWLTGLDASVESHHVAGVIERIGPANGTSTKIVEEDLAVDVKLYDGRLARVLVLKTASPRVGDHIEIAEHIHGSGRHTFSWK